MADNRDPSPRHLLAEEGTIKKNVNPPPTSERPPPPKAQAAPPPPPQKERD